MEPGVRAIYHPHRSGCGGTEGRSQYVKRQKTIVRLRKLTGKENQQRKAAEKSDNRRAIMLWNVAEPGYSLDETEWEAIAQALKASNQLLQAPSIGRSCGCQRAGHGSHEEYLHSIL